MTTMPTTQQISKFVFFALLVPVGCQQNNPGNHSEPPMQSEAIPPESPEPLPPEQSTFDRAQGPDEAAETAMRMGEQEEEEEEEDARVSSDGQEFVQEATQSGMAGVELSEVVLANSRNDLIRDFAQKMVDSHTQINAELNALATRLNAAVPLALTEDAAREVRELEQLSAEDLDQQYIETMIEDYEETIELFGDQVESDEDPELQQFAAKHVPIFEGHLQHARRIEMGEAYPPPQASVHGRGARPSRTAGRP